MAVYEAVPADEAASQGATRDHVGQPIESKKTAQVYVQVPSEDRDRAQRHVEGRCINSFLLMGLSFVFASCSLTIGLLYHFSRVENGLTTEKESHRYAWIYGPTAVIVLLRVLWRVVDLNVKESMPWHELLNGPASAEKTIMLEYLSRTIIGNICRSIKNQHWAVMTTILGNLVLLLMIVFATGIFALESTFVTKHGIPLAQNQFNGSAYNSSMVGASPGLLNFAIESQNLSYPLGTSQDTLVPLFEPIEHPPEDSTYEAYVDGLGVSIDCEVLSITNATKTYLPWWSLQAPYFLSNVSTPDCELINVPVGIGSGGMVRTMNNTQTYSARMSNHVCNSGLDYSTPQSRGQDQGGRLDLTAYHNSLNRTLDNRILISMIDFHFPPNEESEIPGMWINQITSMLCKSTYSIDQYRVKYHQNSTRSTMDFVKKQDTTLSDFYDGDISRGVYNVFRDYEGMYLGMGGSDFVLSDAVPAFFQMIKTLNGGGNFTLKNLMDPNVLKASVESLITGTAIQLLHMNIMTELSHGSDNALQGTLTYIDKRLHVKAISTGFLCAGFAILTILCVTLLFIIPRRPSFKSDMGSVLVVADTLRASPKLAEQFSDHVCNNESSVIRTQKYLSHTSPTSALTIEGMFTSSAGDESPTKPVPGPTKANNTKSTSWWYPASARTWFTAVAVLLSIIIIGVLEGIQQISDKHQGFVAIRNIDIGTTVLAQYVPAAVALSINLMFGSIELVVAATIPFATLRKGNAVASRSLAIDYLTKSGPHLFIRSLANRHLALNVILLTTFVASFLSIVIPGLYSHITIPSTANITILQMDRFDPSGIDISFDDKSAAVMLNLLTYYGIEYPGWAFDDLAIPEFSLPSVGTELHESSDPTSAIVSFKTDALRAKLHCEKVTGRKNWTVEPYAYTGPSREYSEWVSITSSMDLPWSLCSNPPKNISTGSAVTWAQTFLSQNNTAAGDTMHVGKADILKWDEALEDSYRGDLTTGGDGTKESNSGSGLDPDEIALSDWGCPSLAFTLGSVTFRPNAANSTRNYTNIYSESRNWTNLLVDTDVATLVCSQHLQSVETNITLDYPDLTIAAEMPPRPDEATVQWLRNTTATKDGTTFQFVPNNMLLSLNNPNGSLSSPWNQTDDVDRFTQALAYVAQKEDNLTLHDLVGTKNMVNFEQMAQRLYGRYMAQAFSNNMRVNFDKDTSNITLTDTPWTPSSSNYTSKLNARASFSSEKNPRQWQKRADGTVPTVPATLSRTAVGAHTRMVQNRSPKIALQVMLGFMAAGAILTKILLRTKELLPHEPYSIAGRAVLVANGNMLQHGAPGKEGSKEGQRYRLGLWKDRDGVEKYGIYVQE